MKLVFLDKKTIGDDMDFAQFHELGEIVEYDFTSPEEVPARVSDADVVIVNKVPVNAQTIHTAQKLKLVCVTATGTNNLDKDYLAERGIEWRNAAGYSTESVAQHTFAMLFYLMEHLRYYDDYVKEGHYVNDVMFTHFAKTFCQLTGKTWGIIGLGAIGRRVAEIARLFGAEILYYSASGAPEQSGYLQVDFDTLLRKSDIVSVHAPLNTYTEGLMNACAFSAMQPHAIFLNLGRGPIVVEKALADALNAGKIAAAGLDVLCQEPMSPDSPLLGVQDKSRLLITPHIAWASLEARTNLMNIVAGQIKEFIARI
ncbi:MAG: D-2-hydroxyacid dehydrogenase [Ruminococcus sp.]|jgi:glycerate dehydrogenase|nr:D-2-hydroxyacid dehydrogenase [Ruminococcus sp.]